MGKARYLHDELEVDIAAYCQHRLNMYHKKNHNGFNQLFNGGETAIQSIVANNVNKNFGPTQQNGTSLIMFGSLTEQLNMNESGKDEISLGRWAVMMVERESIKTRIVCGYNSCGNSKLNNSTTYQQRGRYLNTKGKDPGHR